MFLTDNKINGLTTVYYTFISSCNNLDVLGQEHPVNGRTKDMCDCWKRIFKMGSKSGWDFDRPKLTWFTQDKRRVEHNI
jgi:hypothetical protein